MLFDKERFAHIESVLIKNGTLAKFEQKSGKIQGRMMIDLIDLPDDLNLEIPEGFFCFGASFDFYDCSMGLILNPLTKKVTGGLWITEQKANAKHPAQEWVEFFIKTLIKYIEPDGSFGYPMYTFVTDDTDMTIVPMAEEIQ